MRVLLGVEVVCGRGIILEHGRSNMLIHLCRRATEVERCAALRFWSASQTAIESESDEDTAAMVQDLGTRAQGLYKKKVRALL